MTLDEIRELISKEINKGTQYDESIPMYMVAALAAIEANYSYKYMESVVDATIPAGSQSVNLFSTRIKRINLVQTKVGGELVKLIQVDPEQVISIGKTPTGFYLVGPHELRFDAEPDANVDCTIFLEKFTWVEWDAEGLLFSVVDGDPQWLIGNFPDFLVAETMIRMAPLCREPDWLQLYKPMLDTARRNAFIADHELRQGSREERMIYNRIS